MRITVHADKVRAELLTAGKHRDAPHHLTQRELDVFLGLLEAGTMRDLAKRLGVSDHSVSMTLQRVRWAFNALNNAQLLYLAYERGYVVIEEGA